MATRKMPPVHPGEILLEEFLEPLGVTRYRLSKDTGVPQTRIGEIVRGERAVTADTALRLGRFFATIPEFWMNLQSPYELEVARDKSGRRIETEVRPHKVEV